MLLFETITVKRVKQFHCPPSNMLLCHINDSNIDFSYISPYVKDNKCTSMYLATNKLDAYRRL